MHRRGFLAALTACCCAPFVRQPATSPVALTFDRWVRVKDATVLSSTHAALARVTRRDLQIVPPGLYIVQDPNEPYMTRHELFMLGEDRKYVGPCVLLARVRERRNETLPVSVEVFIRGDGCEVLTCWTPVEDAHALAYYQARAQKELADLAQKRFATPNPDGTLTIHGHWAVSE